MTAAGTAITMGPGVAAAVGVAVAVGDGRESLVTGGSVPDVLGRR
jgi:hypothetical protein